MYIPPATTTNTGGNLGHSHAAVKASVRVWTQRNINGTVRPLESKTFSVLGLGSGLGCNDYSVLIQYKDEASWQRVRFLNVRGSKVVFSTVTAGQNQVSKARACSTAP